MSIAVKMTNHVLTNTASATNKGISLSSKQSPLSSCTPRPILNAASKLRLHHSRWKKAPDCVNARANYKAALKAYRNVVRFVRMKDNAKRDERLLTLLSNNPSSFYSFIRSSKNVSATKIEKLKVHDKVYLGEKVADGFYDAMTALKTVDMEELVCNEDIAEQISTYEHIKKLSEDKKDLPTLSRKQAASLLHRLKKNVNDFFSVTALHYINAGEEGLTHFLALLNAVIDEVKNASIGELNTALGLILYKGHKKDKLSERSYRTISTCPFLSKALDLYIRDLYQAGWDAKQASTQYQGSGSSHELASLLLTEVIQHSLYAANLPVFLLALDAQSAFDRCLRQILICELHKAGVKNDALILIDNRLANRATVYEWDKELLGPAPDITGFEQGGINSSDYYKLYNNDQLKTSQESLLGVDIGSGVISAIGQADDVVLASSSLYKLQLLVHLTELYCARYRVKLEPSKTKLLVYCPDKQSFLVDHALNSQTIKLNNIPVKIVNETDHVGVLRSAVGNLPHILQRIARHKKALHALLPAGLARRHRGNPAASLKVSQIYGTPVLLSGTASLVLSQAELDILDGHYLHTLIKLLRLHDKTPGPIVYFLAGSLPASALLHQRQLSLLNMICNLKNDPLQKHAYHALLLSKFHPKSWFVQVRNVCLRYGLPHPLELLENPLPKIKFQKLVKQKIAEFWHRQLSAKIDSLSSLAHFNSSYHSLLLPHPLWTTAGCNPHEVNKATILARMVSGRYRTERLCRFWTDNRHGHCLAPGCDKVVGDLQHLLLDCPALEPARSNLIQMWLIKAAMIPPLLQIVTSVLASPASTQMKFILDPISIPEIIQLCQALGWQALECLFYMIRTYAYGLHRKKLIIIGKWPYSTKNENCNVQSNLLSVSGAVKTVCSVPPSTESPWPVHTGVCEASVTQCTVLHHPLLPSSHEPRADGLAGDQHGHHDVPLHVPVNVSLAAVPDTGHTVVPCDGDQYRHQPCIEDSPSNTYLYSSSRPALIFSTEAEPYHGVRVEGVGGPGSDSGRTDLVRVNELVEGQIASRQSQSDKSCRFLSEKHQPAVTNPSYGVTVASVVRAGADCGWTSSGEACVTSDRTEYCTM